MEKIINVGIVGFGMSAQVFHAPFIHTIPGYKLHAVVERTTSLAATKYPGTITYRSFDALLQDDAVDLVIVTTPNETHFPFTLQALAAGKHVVLEKPFTNTTAEAQQLLDAAAQYNRILSVYHNRRYVSDFRTIVQILQQKQLGEVHEYECHFDRYRAEAKPGAWREKPLPGSGILYDLGSHLIDQALCLFGLPKAITAEIKMQRPHAIIDDYFDIRLDFGYAKAILKSSMLVREMGPRYMVHGTLGSFIKSGDDPQEALLKEGAIPIGEHWGKEPDGIEGILHTLIDGQEVRKLLASKQGNFGDYYQRLYATIADEQPLSEKPEHGYNTIRIIELALQSSREKRTIEVTGLKNAAYPFSLP
ncbi:MAG TPA: Gfo/Idh/MocA family oxidoreductase [Phnomibacter sp.]|nr:Gfo/Idh/MocA family oxidoreductase [Phnomibacter sp.]